MKGTVAKKVARLQIIGSIDYEAYTAFSAALTEREKAKAGTVDIELSSEGGDDDVALAFYHRMISSPCNLRVLCTGLVASAAVLVLAAGDERCMARDSWVMVHESSAKISGTTSELERKVRRLRSKETQWTRLLAERTGVGEHRWSSLHKGGDTHLNAAACKELGLIHEIV